MVSSCKIYSEESQIIRQKEQKMSMQCRSGESGEKLHFRASRFFNVADNYYFNTREGNDVGPFPSMAAAQRGALIYIRCMKKKPSLGTYATKIALQGLWASTDFS